MHGIFLSQSLRAAIGPLQFSLRHWNLRNLTLHSGMLPYKHASRSLEIFSANTGLSHGSIINAAASPASRLRSAGSLAIKNPTRLTEDTSSTIDLIFVNSCHRIVTHGVQECGISDHSIVFATKKSGFPKGPAQVREIRSYKN